MPQSLRDFAAEVETRESFPPDDAIAAVGWATPSEWEAAQALVLRQAKVRLSRMRRALTEGPRGA
jgi:hypothetical protein